MGIKQYVTVVLICILLMISEAEHLFICLFAIYMPSAVRCLNFFCPFFSWVVWLFFPYQFVVVLYILWDNSPPLYMRDTISRIGSLIWFEVGIYWNFSFILSQLIYGKVCCLPTDLNAMPPLLYKKCSYLFIHCKSTY